MEITKKVLEQKIAKLEAQKAQAVGQVNAITGAIMVAQELLVDLSKKAPEPKKAPELKKALEPKKSKG